MKVTRFELVHAGWGTFVFRWTFFVSIHRYILFAIFSFCHRFGSYAITLLFGRKARHHCQR